MPEKIAWAEKIKWDKIYKKKVQSVETTVDVETGEVLQRKEKALEFDKNVNFTKFFGVDISRLLALNKQECIIFLSILENVAYWNDVFFKDIERMKIFPKNNSQRVRNAFTGLVRNTILIRTELRGLYKLNPEIALKGDVRTFKKLIWAY